MLDVVVVGGGIIGASAGYNLARAGARVTLVDREDLGTATSAAAGIISALDDNPPHEEWSGYAFPAMRYYSALATELEDLGETDHSFRVMGELKLSVAAEPEKDLKAKLAQRQAVIDSFGSEGIGTNVLIGSSEIRQICPLLEGVELAIWHDQIANVDGLKFRRAVLNAMQKLGGTYVRGSGELRVKAGRVEGVDVDGEFLPCDVVILASGSWAGQNLGPLGLSSDVYSMRGQITHAHLPGAGDIPPIVGINGHYVLSFPDDRVVFGATREKDVFEHDVTVGGVMENIREVARIIPSIVSASLIETRVGFRPFTTDRIPHIGRASSIEGLLLGLGISSQGMTLGAYTGAALADQALGVPGREIPAAFGPRL
jgi:D-amino-acid dehydrogenase